MGKKDKQLQKFTNASSDKNREEPQTSHDILSKEQWDQFYTITSCNFFSELHAEWPQLQSLLTSHLVFPLSPQLSESAGAPPPQAVKSEEVRILVPGCGNSRLSEHLYDAGFTNITNVDFSLVVISHMLNRNVRKRPGMKWRVMDMTSMKFENETFDAVVDKEGLDGLMDPNLGPRLGSLYLSQVKRLLKTGGKYICVTLAKPHILAILFPKFRFGWEVKLYAIAHETSYGDLHQQAFMVVAKKLGSTVVSQISLFLDECSLADEFKETLEVENGFRTRYSNTPNMSCPPEDLILGLKVNLTQLQPSRKVFLTLGEFGVSRFFYDCILFDAPRDSGPFTHQFRVFAVPRTPNLEWAFSISQRQWLIVKTNKTARLLMVALDSRHFTVHMDIIKRDLFLLVKQLAPADYNGVDFPFMLATEGIKERQILHQVTSDLTGPIVVDDVVYEKPDRRFPDNSTIRRLSVRSFVESEVLLSREGSIGISSKVEKQKVQATSKTRKKGKQKKNHSQSSRSCAEASGGTMKVNHNYLASPQHNAIVSGLMLICFHLKVLVKTIVIGLIPIFEVKTVVIGLRTGLLPMFMNNCLPDMKIEVVELDPMILDIAKEYFEFREDERLKVHVTDGIKFVREKLADCDAGKQHQLIVDADGKGSSKVDILIVDVDALLSTRGFCSPRADFVDESFLLDVKKLLCKGGLFVINFISWSSVVKGKIYSRLKRVFRNLFSIQLEEDVNEVIFALNTDSPINENHLEAARNSLARSLDSERHEWSQKVIDASRLIKPLR